MGGNFTLDMHLSLKPAESRPSCWSPADRIRRELRTLALFGAVHEGGAGAGLRAGVNGNPVRLTAVGQRIPDPIVFLRQRRGVTSGREAA